MRLAAQLPCETSHCDTRIVLNLAMTGGGVMNGTFALHDEHRTVDMQADIASISVQITYGAARAGARRLNYRRMFDRMKTRLHIRLHRFDHDHS